MLSEVKKRLEGPEFNIDFGGKGLVKTGEGDKYIHYAKRGHFFGSVSTLLSLIVGQRFFLKRIQNGGRRFKLDRLRPDEVHSTIR